MINDRLKNGYFIGIVEDNVDTEKKQRIRIRVPFLHGTSSEIPTEYLPWARPERDLDGKTYSIPDVNKVVSVRFPTGSPYMPVYCESLHLDKNLQQKIESYSESELIDFKAFCFDYNTQIYKDAEKLTVSYKFNSMDIYDDAIVMAFKDQNTLFKIGDNNADEAMILGTSFFDWFNSFLDALGNGFVCNGMPVVMIPTLMSQVMQFKTLYETKFLSKNAFISKNFNIESKKTDVISETGDTFAMTEKESVVSVTGDSSPKQVNFLPLPAGVNKQAVEEAKFNPVIGHSNGQDIYGQSSTNVDLNNVESLREVSKPQIPEVKSINRPTGTSKTMVVEDSADNSGTNIDNFTGEYELSTSWSFDATNSTSSGTYDEEFVDFDALIDSSDEFIASESTAGGSMQELSSVNFEMPLKVETSVNKQATVRKLERYMKSKNYKVNYKPNVLNIVGFRNNVKESGKITNKFDDKMVVWYYDSNKTLNYHEFTITTTPGYLPKQTYLPGGPSGSGVAMMWYGQYQYSIKYHQNDSSHPCLGNATTFYFRNKPNGNRYYTLSEAKDKIVKAAVGLNIHASDRGNSQCENVNNWSEGCQVFKKGKEWKNFMALCFNQRDQAKESSFLYTLVSEKEFYNYK